MALKKLLLKRDVNKKHNVKQNYVLKTYVIPYAAYPVCTFEL